MGNVGLSKLPFALVTRLSRSVSCELFRQLFKTIVLSETSLRSNRYGLQLANAFRRTFGKDPPTFIKMPTVRDSPVVLFLTFAK